MKKINRPALLLMAFLINLLVLSCSSEGEKKTSGEPKHGGTMVIGITGDVDSFNPLYAETATAQELNHLMLLGLADLDDKAEFVPEIAERWEHSDDYLKLTYYLRKDARWSDGNPITAADVKFTYDLLMDPQVASPRQADIGMIEKVVVVDSHTVTFRFSEAYPSQIFNTAGEILPEHILKDVDRSALRGHRFGRNPLASGPFRLNKWVRQQYIELVPNEQYFGDRPYLDKLIFKIVPDQTTLLMQLESGEVDMMSGIPPAEVARLKQKNDNIEIHQVSGRVYYYIGYNQKNEIFRDKQVRRALTMAIDRQKMIDALLYGYGRKSLGPLPPIVEWAYNESVEEIPFDPEKARASLNNLGWTDSDSDGILDKNGKPFKFDLITNTGNQIKADAAVVVQDQLGKIGVKVNIQMLEWNNFIDHLQSHDFDACLNSLSSSYYIDPTPVFHSTATNLFNATYYSNPEVDKLIETGREEMDRTKAANIWRDFQQLIYEDQPYTFLFWLDKAVGVNSRFENVTPTALSMVYNIEKWYVGEN